MELGYVYTLFSIFCLDMDKDRPDAANQFIANHLQSPTEDDHDDEDDWGKPLGYFFLPLRGGEPAGDFCHT
jgi:hypothetical protein